MSETQLSNYLKPGTKLASVFTVPDPQHGSAAYVVGERDWEAKDITVIEECGQMCMVPWARVEMNSGEVRLVNLANIESVTFPKEQP